MPALTLDMTIVARLCIAVVLGLSSLGKWLSFEWFVGILRDYQLLPRSAATPIALLIAATETVTALALGANVGGPWPAYMAMALLLAFTGAVTVNLLRGRRQIQCGSGGHATGPSLSWPLVCRNLGLLGMAFPATGYRPMASDSAALAWFGVSVATVVISVFAQRRRARPMSAGATVVPAHH